jgi:hypothetical protein
MSAGWPFAPYSEAVPLEAVYADALAMADDYPDRRLPTLGQVDLHDTGADWERLTGELSAEARLADLYAD